MPTKVNPLYTHLTNSIPNNRRAIDLMYQFRNENLWRANTSAANSLIGLLSQHTKQYFSPFRAAFLFEMKSLGAVNYFSPILVRDGALTLLKFFYDNPKPRNEDMLLIINDKLKNIIPTSWSENVFTYKLTSNKNFNYSAKKIKVLFLSTQLGGKHCSMEYVSTLFSELSLKAKESVFEIYFSSFQSEIAEIPETSNALIKHNFELYTKTLALFNTVPIIKNPDKLESENLVDFLFCDLNEFNFYYSDSYFYHLLLCRGSRDFADKPDNLAPIFEAPLSQYHKIQIFDFTKTDVMRSRSQNTENLLNEFRGSKLLSEDQASYRPEKFNFSNKICSPSFEDFAYDVMCLSGKDFGSTRDA